MFNFFYRSFFSNIREAIINTFNVVLQSTPSHYLMNDLYEDIMQFKLWLKGMLHIDLI